MLCLQSTVASEAYSRTLAALTELQSAKPRREHCTGEWDSWCYCSTVRC